MLNALSSITPRSVLGASSKSSLLVQDSSKDQVLMKINHKVALVVLAITREWVATSHNNVVMMVQGITREWETTSNNNMVMVVQAITMKWVATSHNNVSLVVETITREWVTTNQTILGTVVVRRDSIRVFGD